MSRAFDMKRLRVAAGAHVYWKRWPMRIDSLCGSRQDEEAQLGRRNRQRLAKLQEKRYTPAMRCC
ncbi:MAG: hypothetical protein RMK97_06080 [Sutterellaceae bacterium]|nr:hypothetical protein [Burkholderiaceae bacterium]MDW8430057.1 hypothetical protein [Sutterellaceae bacterium]